MDAFRQVWIKLIKGFKKKMIKINKDDYQSGRNNKNFFIFCPQNPFITDEYQLKLEVLIL